MGGSGGFFGDKNLTPKPDEVARTIREAIDNSKFKVYELEIDNLIGSLISKINDRDHEEIRNRLETFKDILEKEIEGTVDLRYGGSVAKHTYVDGLSDIDSLVYLNNSELTSKSPDEVKSYFFDKVKKAFKNEEIIQGNLAVTIKFKTGSEIQLLPAVKFKSGYKIASENNQWSNIINPDRFAKLLRGTNIRMRGKLLPVVKLAKSIISNLPEGLRISGYHAEAISISAFYNYKGDRKIRPMLKHFFSEASKIVLKTIKDKTGQSTHVDDYLGKNNSLNRKILSNRFDQINRSMTNADLMRLTEPWKKFLK